MSGSLKKGLFCLVLDTLAHTREFPKNTPRLGSQVYRDHSVLGSIVGPLLMETLSYDIL